MNELVRELTDRQHGLATLDQLAKAGVSESAVMRAVRAGRWRRVRRGLYSLAGATETNEQRLHAAVLAVGTDAVASHRAAAWLHGLKGFTKLEIEVSVAGPRRANGVHVHRIGELDRRDCMHVRWVPVTRPALTLVDLAAVADPEVVAPALDDALRKNLVRLALVQRLLDERGTQGRKGAAVLAKLLAVRSGKYVATESPLEDRFEALILAAGLPRPTRQLRLRDELGRVIARVDFAYEQERIAIWLDGFTFHADRTAFVRDHAQAQEAARLGWRHVRFTWESVTQGGAAVIDTVRSMLAEKVFTPAVGIRQLG
jgi:very-short-patch-repair endonuclease